MTFLRSWQLQNNPSRQFQNAYLFFLIFWYFRLLRGEQPRAMEFINVRNYIFSDLNLLSFYNVWNIFSPKMLRFAEKHWEHPFRGHPVCSVLWNRKPKFLSPKLKKHFCRKWKTLKTVHCALFCFLRSFHLCRGRN